ncbi:glycosyltransferase family protein [Paenibacillus andongensis]|uniref:glycosyltransferase family protein n=1 Tax=Paenibacillus andongensis TaxID=2975482 RepID=UPI0021BB3238|nr:glycosyltransferase family protein [Paenibacillus andongensis]
MQISAVVASRMTSSRLPGKIMMDLAGQPALIRLIERLRKSRYINDIVIATTINKSDDIVEDTAKEQKVLCYRGSEEDVLLRTLRAAEVTNTDLIIQITSDCPLMDAETIDVVIERMLENPYLDFVTNQMFLTYPLGFGVEVFRTSLLKEIEQLTQDPADREHVSLYIYERPETFHLSNIEAPVYLRRPNFRLTLDTVEDYELIRKIYEELYPINKNFDLYQIVNFLSKNTELLSINSTIQQRNAR